MNNRPDNAEWILRNTRRILKDVGPKAARRFLEQRGGTAKWQAAAREIARHVLREQASNQPGKKIIVFSPSLSGSSHAWWVCRDQFFTY